MCWPHVWFYDKQVEIIESVLENDETFVPAGNMLGKDFIAGFIALWFFMAHSNCRVVTTSVKDDHLRVLWGEIGRFIQSSSYPISRELGGPLVVNHRDIRKVVKGQVDQIDYLRGMVSERGEGMAGHHARHTLQIIDEASGVDDLVYTQGDTWAEKKLIIGNPNPCSNFFRSGVKAGDLLSAEGDRFYRKVIRIQGADSPNVRLALKQESLGVKPTNEILLPGVLPWDVYQKRLATWDPIRLCIGVYGEFYEGAEVLLYPPEYLNRAEQVAEKIKHLHRTAETMGVDSAEGGDDTVWTIIDRLGILKQISIQTLDTSVISGRTIALMNEYKLKPEAVLFDRGGGGKQHADYLRQKGFNVRTVGFGETAGPEIRKKIAIGGREKRKVEETEERTAYKNRRAEMYGMLRYNLLDPAINPAGFGIPAELTELRRQLSPIPLLWDGEGRLYLPPKDKKNPDAAELTLRELLGCSPDEADSLVLAVYGLFSKSVKRVMGAS